MLEELIRYLKRLGVVFTLAEESVEAQGLPLFVKLGNEWRVATVGGVRYVLALALQDHDSPESVLVHWRVVQRFVGEATLLVLRPADAEFCAVLEREGVAYVMPGFRISIPGVFRMVTREAPAIVRQPRGRMTINAQLAVLWYLLHGKDGRVSFQDLIKKAGLPKNRVTDIGKELEQIKLARIDKAWKNHGLLFADAKIRLWERALPLLASPVQSRIRVKNPPKGLARAGILALSEKSMLAEDPFATYAISRKDERLKSFEPLKYEGDVVEVWKYDPAQLSNDASMVDDLSLYLTLKDDPDARVQGELRSVMENRQW